jgi:flavodoxin I
MGLGDQRNYPDTFGDAAAILADRVSDRGATLVGHTVPEDYEYTASRSERENKLVGLLIDEDSQSHLTDVRLKNWVNMLRRQFDV